MAKSKRKIGSTPTKAKGVDQRVAHLIWLLLGAVIFIFLFASVFDAAGQLGTYLHTWMRLAVGEATPLFAVLLLAAVALRIMRNQVTLRLITVLGIILFVLVLVGLIHSFTSGTPQAVAQAGNGGGTLGFLVESAVYSLVGILIGRLLLIVLMVISLVLVFENTLLPILMPRDEEEEGEETQNDDPDTRVRVMGQITGKLRDKMGRPAIVTAGNEKKTQVPVITLSRSANWNYPLPSLLENINEKPEAGNIQKRSEQIRKTLADFGIEVTMADAYVGPTVTQYTLKPADGVKLNQITARQDDLALSLAAQSLRVEAPIPGKGLVGVEIPNDVKAKVGLRKLLESKEFITTGSKLALALGLDAAGEPAIADLARMPHALVAGATGSGKSVCINSIILSLLTNNSPDELRMILVDPKRVELTGYNGLPHLLTPVITEPKDTVAALAWAVREMERRYKLFQHLGKRNIEQYNLGPDLAEGRMPFIVIIIDELADMMMVAAREVESSIVRLAQMARAVGIHLIVATQRPSVDVITGLIKANIPTRIAFAVASQIDSRTIIDMSGAEKLLGYGDMLYVGTDTPKPKRVQGVFASERDINTVIAHIKQQEEGDRYDPSVLETRVESRLGGSRENGEIDDDLFNEAYEVVRQAGKASSTLLQTRLSVGYARAARLIQALEDKGLIGPAKGAKPREVYGMSIEDEAAEHQGIAAYPEGE